MCTYATDELLKKKKKEKRFNIFSISEFSPNTKRIPRYLHVSVYYEEFQDLQLGTLEKDSLEKTCAAISYSQQLLSQLSGRLILFLFSPSLPLSPL